MLVAGTAVLAVMGRDVSGALILGAVGYALVGSLILARRPGHRMGPLLCAIALATGIRAEAVHITPAAWRGSGCLSRSLLLRLDRRLRRRFIGLALEPAENLADDRAVLGGTRCWGGYWRR